MNVLVLNLISNTIGDNILLTPFLSILRRSFSGRLDMTVSPLNAAVFENNPDIDNLIEVPELKLISDRKAGKVQKLKAYVGMVHRLSSRFRKRYDKVYIPPPNFFLNVAIPKLAGARKIYGYTYKGSILSFLLTKKIKYRGLFETKDYERHFVESYLDLLRISGVDFRPEDVVSRVYVTDDELAQAKKLLKEEDLDRFIAFQSGSKDNSWPIDRFRELAKRITKDSKYKIALMGSPAEKAMNEKIARSPDVVNLSGAASLRVSMAVLKLAKFSVCNDSGLAHMSSALGTRTIVMYGPHSPKHCRPLGPGKVTIIYKYADKFPYAVRGSKEGMERIESITVDDVYDEVKKHL
jgi:ADP-heptose:LPS heptosyltransferase